MTAASTQIQEMAEALHGDVDNKRDRLIAAVRDTLRAYEANPCGWRWQVLRQAIDDLGNYEATQ